VRKTVTGAMSSMELLKTLLAAGADPNARKAMEIRQGTAEQNLAIDNGVNLGGATPFLLAAKNGDVEAMRLLLAHGADARITTIEHSSALLLASGVGWVENSDAGMRTEDEFLEAVNVLLDLGLNVNLPNDQRQSVIHGAVYRGMNRLLQRLLERGADPNVEDEQGRTPLVLAQRGFNQLGHIRRDEQVVLLRQQGAR
jgi:ankyrin repeat protein